MSHEVFESRLAFAGPTPWHGIGRRLPKNATVEEIVEAAQFFKVTTAPLYLKKKADKADNGKGVEGALGPTGLRGRVFGTAHGETEGGTPGPGGSLDRRVPHGRARWTFATLFINQPEAARAGRWWVGG
jgi:hypothetical protein